MVDPPVSGSLSIQDNKRRKNTRGTSMPRVVLEPTISVFEWAKTFSALDRTAIVFFFSYFAFVNATEAEFPACPVFFVLQCDAFLYVVRCGGVYCHVRGSVLCTLNCLLQRTANKHLFCLGSYKKLLLIKNHVLLSRWDVPRSFLYYCIGTLKRV